MTTTWICDVGLWTLGVELDTDDSWWVVARPQVASSGSQPVVACDDDGPDTFMSHPLVSLRVAVRQEMGDEIPSMFSMRHALWRWSAEARQSKKPIALSASHFIACNIRCPRSVAQYTPGV